MFFLVEGGCESKTPWNWRKNEFPSDKKGAEGESDGNVEAEKAGDHLDLLKMLLICS